MFKSLSWILPSFRQHQEKNPPMNEDSQAFQDTQYQDDSEVELSEDDAGDDDEDEGDDDSRGAGLGTGNGGAVVPADPAETAEVEDPNPGMVVEHQEGGSDEIPPTQPPPLEMIEIEDTPVKNDKGPMENEDEVPAAPSSLKDTFVRKRSDVEDKISELTKKMNHAKKLLTSQYLVPISVQSFYV